MEGVSHYSVSMPAWRPGRYELVTLPRITSTVGTAFDADGKELAAKKLTQRFVGKSPPMERKQ